MQNEKEEFKNQFHKRLIRFSLAIISFCSKIREDKNLRPLADQLIRSATSIGANIIEAKSASSKRDYIHSFEIAHKSSNETLYWLILIRESSAQHTEEAVGQLKECTEITKIIGTGLLTMKGKK